MERIKLFEWVKGVYGTEPDYPWNDWKAVLRHVENIYSIGTVNC